MFFCFSCNQIEGYTPGSTGGLYKREVIDAYLPNGNVLPAYVYYQEIPQRNKKLIEEGFMKDCKYFENGDWFPEKTNYTGLILIKPTKENNEEEEEEKNITQNSNSTKEEI